MGDADCERHEVDVLVALDAGDEPSTDEVTLTVLQHDAAWTWIHDPQEDVYTEANTRPAPGD